MKNKKMMLKMLGFIFILIIFSINKILIFISSMQLIMCYQNIVFSLLFVILIKISKVLNLVQFTVNDPGNDYLQKSGHRFKRHKKTNK